MDSMQSMPNIQCIQSCCFGIKWVGSGTPSSLCHKINLVGAIEGHDSVTINYTSMLWFGFDHDKIYLYYEM